MSKTFKRPMFRKGGNVGTGIMNGIVDRSMHATNPIVSSEPIDYEQRFMEKVVGAGGLPQGMDPLTSYLLTAGPQISQSTSFADAIGNLEGPNKALIEQQNERAKLIRNLKTGAAQFGLEGEMQRDLQAQKEKSDKELLQMQIDAGRFGDKAAMDPFKISSYETFRKAGDSHTVATNKANYDVDFEGKLIEKIDRKRLGGVIEQDISTQKKFEDWVRNKRGGSKIGKVFFDPVDGIFKQLVQDETGIRFKNFGKTVESVTLKEEVIKDIPVTPKKPRPDIFSPDVEDAMA
jgi:hypothetical protein